MGVSLTIAQEALIRNTLLRAATDEGPAPSGGIVLIGERVNVDAGPFRLPPTLQHKELDLDFLLRVSAFPEGSSRRRLQGVGLRWDAALNLLLPDRIGRWEDARADEVAAAIRDPLARRFRWVVMLGRRVATAFKVSGDPFQRYGNFVTFPHPSGRNSFWRSRENIDVCRAFVQSLI